MMYKNYPKTIIIFFLVLLLILCLLAGILLGSVPQNSTIISARRIAILGMASLFSVSPESDPIINEVRLIVISESNSLMVLMPAFKKLDTVIALLSAFRSKLCVNL